MYLFLYHKINRLSNFTMKQITINIPEAKYPFFKELIENLGLEMVEEQTAGAGEDVLTGIEQGFREVRLIQEGKIKGTGLKDFLDEL